MNSNQEQIELVELTGCDNWSDVVEWFHGMTEIEIERECNNCWPHEDNRDIAHRLYTALKY